MRTQNLTRSYPLILYLSISLGTIILFLRILTLPRSFEAILLWDIVLALNYTAGFFLGFKPQIMGYPLYQEILISGVTVLFLIVLIWSFLSGLLRYKRVGASAFTSLGVNLLNLLLFIYMNQILIQPDFYFNRADRQTVVSLIQAKSSALVVKNERNVDIADTGRQPKRLYTVTLPVPYQSLSSGFYLKGKGRPEIKPGDVEVVSREDGSVQAIVFFRSSGSAQIGPIYTAFVYKPDDSPVILDDLYGVAGLTFYLGIDDRQKLQPNWYWVDVSED